MQQGLIRCRVRAPTVFTASPRCSDGKGGRVTAKVFEGIGRVPYQWVELAAEMAAYPDAPVFCTEGEKDCDNVRKLGLFATCAAGSVWTPEIAAVLKDRDVVVLEDNDKAGRDKAAKAGQALHGIARSVRIASFPELPEKGDVSDWIDLDPEQHNADALVTCCCTAPLFNDGQLLGEWDAGDDDTSSRRAAGCSAASSAAVSFPRPRRGRRRQKRVEAGAVAVAGDRPAADRRACFPGAAAC